MASVDKGKGWRSISDVAVCLATKVRAQTALRLFHDRTLKFSIVANFFTTILELIKYRGGCGQIPPMNRLSETRLQDGSDRSQEKTVGESGAYGPDRQSRDKATSLKMDALLAEIRNLLTQVS